VVSISAKMGCTAQTLLEWVKTVEVDRGKRVGVPTEMAEKLRPWSGRTANCARPTSSGGA
jgi:transposase-like protein